MFDAQEIPVAEVPLLVLEIAAARVDGFTAKSAEKGNMSGSDGYEIKGFAGGLKVEMKILADGTILKLEKEIL